jgi:hypothetical protein
VFPIRPAIKSQSISRRSSLALAAIASLTLASASFALPAAAQAATTTVCPSTTLVQPFLKYSDENYYSLVKGGSFEGSTAGWSFYAGAKVASGGEPSTVGGSLGADSLKLPAGASAESPFTCVEPNDRTFRFYAHSEGASATIVATVLYETILGNVAVPVKVVSVKSGWEVSPIIHSGAAVATAVMGGVAHLALFFTSTSGTARIDDVYLDPRMR